MHKLHKGFHREWYVVRTLLYKHILSLICCSAFGATNDNLYFVFIDGE